MARIPVHCYKFDEIRSSNPGVDDVRMCAAGVDHCSGLFNYVRVGLAWCALRRSVLGLFHYYLIGGDTARPASCTLGSATLF